MPKFKVRYVENSVHITIVQAPSLSAVEQFIENNEDNMSVFVQNNGPYSGEIEEITLLADNRRLPADYKVDADGERI